MDFECPARLDGHIIAGAALLEELANGDRAHVDANDVAATWNGVTTTDVADTNFSNMTIASTTPFFGSLWTAHNIRVFGPGTYSFDTTCTVAQLEAGTTVCNNALDPGQTEQFLTMTVGPDQIGVHILFDWSVNKNIDVVNVYDINAEFTTDSTLGGEHNSCNERSKN